jgi:hypothetical protein
MSSNPTTSPAAKLIWRWRFDCPQIAAVKLPAAAGTMPDVYDVAVQIERHG